MVKSTRTQRLRQKVSEDVKRSKQVTLDTLPHPRKENRVEAVSNKLKKIIEIIDAAICSREDELELKVAFKLLPTRKSFSRVTADLFFDGEKVDSLRLRILQGPLATDCFEFSSVLDMTGIPPGPHVLKVELYELWSSPDKPSSTSKELSIDYIPLRREDRLVRVPIVKSYAGTSIAIVSDLERSIHREIEEEMKREAVSQRDKW